MRSRLRILMPSIVDPAIRRGGAFGKSLALRAPAGLRSSGHRSRRRYLLGGILQHGSLAQTVREIGWSYRHAWGYLRRVERALKTPIVRNRPGRGTPRGMELTETGHLLLERLRALRDRIDDALGPSGPTPAEVAARGRGMGQGPRTQQTPVARKTRTRRAIRSA
jgi:molybdate transport repressor ModE-like protein